MFLASIEKKKHQKNKSLNVQEESHMSVLFSSDKNVIFVSLVKSTYECVSVCGLKETKKKLKADIQTRGNKISLTFLVFICVPAK